MGSKEVMVVAPVLILLYDRTFLAGTVRQAIRQRRALYLGLALSWVVLAMLVVSGARTTTAGFGVAHLTPWAYALTQSRVILHYLRLAVWPHPLVLDYSDWPIATSLAEVAGPAVAVTLLVMATLWLLRKQPAVGFIGAWMFLILAPTSSVMPIVTEIAAERRMYLPLITVVVFLVLTTWELLGGVIRPRTMRTRVAACAVVGLLAILSGLTLRRNVQYQSEMGMLHDVIAKRPRNARAHYNLGVALAEQRQEEAAIANFTEALRLSPDYAEAHGNLGVVLAERGHWEEAIAHYTRALRLRPDLAEAHNNMSVALARQGRVDEALFHSLEALRLRPDSTAAYNNWRRVMAQRARRSE